MVKLIALPYSPWSERARWALDHHHIAYREEEHIPMLGEWALRLRTGRLSGKATVPTLLVDHGEALCDSLDIANYAEGTGTGTRLFPDAHRAAIDTWHTKSEAALGSARALYIRRLLLSEQAKKDTLPGFIPTPLRGAFSPMTSMGASYLARKYAIATDLNRHETELVRILGDVDKALGGRRHLLGDDFTFADITMAVVLQLVAPVANEYLVLSPALRSVSTEPSLAARFSGLVEWRDALYAAHRKTR